MQSCRALVVCVATPRGHWPPVIGATLLAYGLFAGEAHRVIAYTTAVCRANAATQATAPRQPRRVVRSRSSHSTMPSSSNRIRVLAVYGSESGTAKRGLDRLVKKWANKPDRRFDVLDMVTGNVLAKMLETIYFNEHIADVADLMRTEVLSMKPYDSIIELGQLMLKNKPKVYPVIDDDGNLLGTICRNDVLQAIDSHMRANLKISKKHAEH